jgi:hypothetical protein
VEERISHNLRYNVASYISWLPAVRCARQRCHRTQISISKFLGAVRSQAYKFYAIIYKSNSKNTLRYCYHTVLKIGVGMSETSFMCTIHYVVSKHTTPRPKSTYGCISVGKFDFLFQALCKRLRLCGRNFKGITDKPTNTINFF